MNDPQVIVVGGGIGGAACALRAAQYHLPAVWILGDAGTRKSSRAAYVRNIDNMLGIHPGIVKDEVARLLAKDHPEAAKLVAEAHLHIGTDALVANARARIERDYASHVLIAPERAVSASRTGSSFQVAVAGGATFEAPNVIVAAGVMDRQPTIHRMAHGRDLSGIQWVFPYANQETFLYCIRCEGHLTPGRRVAVIGAGKGAAGVALRLRERYGCEVVILPADEQIRWGPKLARLLAAEDVTVVEGKLLDVKGSDRGARLRGFVVEGGRDVEIDLAFVAMGLHRVWNDLARELGARLEESTEPEERRHVLIDHRGETTIPGLFAVGDMAQRADERVMKQVYTAQEYAVRAIDAIDERRSAARRRALLDAEAGSS